MRAPGWACSAQACSLTLEFGEISVGMFGSRAGPFCSGGSICAQPRAIAEAVECARLWQWPAALRVAD
eukprot:313238-Lingulodinium_polyedra.AAC.1